MTELPGFTFGIEEEYHLASLETEELADAPVGLLDTCQSKLGDRVTREYLKSQIEVGTRPHHVFADARSELAELRATLVACSAQMGVGPVASGTHPLSRRKDTSRSEQDRYIGLEHELGGTVRRLVACGMHVHVGIEDDDKRIDIMNQVRYFVPHLMMLATSSPFWEREATGLQSFRSVLLDGMPRTGLPQDFASFNEYRRTVDVLIDAGVIEDASKIWWDLRPSTKFPTLELRALDVCTRIDDAISIAAIYVCLCRMLFRLRLLNMRWRNYSVFLINENRWRAQRYGVDGTLFDFGQNALVPYPQLLEEIIALIAEDADALGCTREVEHARTIVKSGTSADLQSRIFKSATEGGDTPDAALREVAIELRKLTADV